MVTQPDEEAELRFGLQLLPDGRRRAALTDAINAILREGFRGRVRSFDGAAAKPYATVAELDDCGIAVIDPWTMVRSSRTSRSHAPRGESGSAPRRP